jgi:hypothetical protein
MGELLWPFARILSLIPDRTTVGNLQTRMTCVPEKVRESGV